MTDMEANKPRMLLVEDDPISLEYLTAVLQAIPADVVSAQSRQAALQQLQAAPLPFDLWLFDSNLPDGQGDALLAELRARGLTAPALAHTADASPETCRRLLQAGFCEVLVKPINAVLLRNAARTAIAAGAAHLHTSHPQPAPSHGDDWDDTIALTALSGNLAHVEALRQQFLQELPSNRRDLQRAWAQPDPEAVRGLLHQLRASCGFVGAAGVLARVAGVQAEMDSTQARAQLLAAIDRLLATAPHAALGEHS